MSSCCCRVPTPRAASRRRLGRKVTESDGAMDLVEEKERRAGSEVRHPWETARVEVVRTLIRRLVRLDPTAIVMDIGCGDTFVVEQLAADYQQARFYAIDTA